MTQDKDKFSDTQTQAFYEHLVTHAVLWGQYETLQDQGTQLPAELIPPIVVNTAAMLREAVVIFGPCLGKTPDQINDLVSRQARHIAQTQREAAFAAQSTNGKFDA